MSLKQLMDLNLGKNVFPVYCNLSLVSTELLLIVQKMRTAAKCRKGMGCSGLKKSTLSFLAM